MLRRWIRRTPRRSGIRSCLVGEGKEGDLNPIGLDVGEEGLTEDRVVIEIDDSKVDSTNFVGNVIDLGTTIPIDEFTAWMFLHPANPPSFEYPGNRLLKPQARFGHEEI